VPTKYGKAANLIFGNIRLAISVIVGLVLVRVLIAHLGLGRYGLVALVISISSIIKVLGHSLSGAAGRYLTQSIAKDDDALASSYMTNTLGALLTVGSAVIVGLGGYSLLAGAVIEEMGTGFLMVILVGAVGESVAGVLGAGNFARERFVSKELAASGVRILYGVVCYVLLVHCGAGVWSVAIGMAVAALVNSAIFLLLFRRNLPNVRLDIRRLQAKRMVEVGAFVGWMLLVFCGSYILRTGTMWVVKKTLAQEMLGKYALAIVVANMLARTFDSVGNVTSPPIYRHLAQGLRRRATGGIERHVHMVTIMGGIMVLCLAFEGRNMLDLLLRDGAPAGIMPILLGCMISAMLIDFARPFSVFLAGMNKQRGLGIIWAVEGCAVVACTVLILHDGQDRLEWVAFLPGLSAILKIAVVNMIYGKLFEFAPKLQYVRKALAAAVLGAVVVGVRLGLGRWVTGTGVVGIAVRVTAMCIPVAIVVAVRFFGVKRSGPLPPAEVAE